MGDESAEIGTRIHLARERLDDGSLSEDEREIYLRGIATEKAELERWEADFGLSGSKEYKEKRIWLHWPNTLDAATSGKLDVHYVSDKHVLIVEWKTLWCTNLTPAERNYQGLVQAVCAAKEYEATHVRVVFNKAMFGKSDVVEYDAQSLRWAEDQVFSTLWKANQEGAPLHAGPWCRYCPCQPHCAAAKGYAMLPSVVAGTDASLSKEEIAQRVQRLCPQDWVTIWKRKAEIQSILASVQECLKSLSEPDLKELGLKLKEGRRLDPITDTIGAYSAFELKLPEESLLKSISLSKTDLVEVWAETFNVSKKDATAQVKDILAPFIEERRAAPTLEEI